MWLWAACLWEVLLCNIAAAVLNFHWIVGIPIYTKQLSTTDAKKTVIKRTKLNPLFDVPGREFPAHDKLPILAYTCSNRGWWGAGWTTSTPAADLMSTVCIGRTSLMPVTNMSWNDIIWSSFRISGELWAPLRPSWTLMGVQDSWSHRIMNACQDKWLIFTKAWIHFQYTAGASYE